MPVAPSDLTPPLPSIALTPASAEDFDALVALRIAAMRDSLTRLGRFDPVRARERFRDGFDAARTRHIEWGDRRVGFVVTRPEPEHGWLKLDHLYIDPAWQGRRIGAAVLADVFAQADRLGLPVRVGALRGSDSNRFYRRHGFELVEEGEFDLYYLRRSP